MMKRIAALLLTLVLLVPAFHMAAAAPDKNLTANGSYKYGSTGDGVTEIQTLLTNLGYFSGTINGKYNQATENAVKWFQRCNGLKADGVVGTATLAVLKSSSALKPTDVTASHTTANGSLTIGSAGAEVLDVQTILQNLNYYKGPLDGFYSKETADAVKAFQRNNNLRADGIVGPYTMLKLKTGIPWDEEYNYETMETEYPFTQPAAVGQTQNGSYFLGASGPDIAAFQQKLKDLGYYEGPIDGVFGKEMEDALKLFQTRNGLKADGMIGKNTAVALNDPSAIKKTDLVPEYFVLSSGSASLYVKNLQTILKNHYFYHGKLDGVYGPDMVAAVRNLQAAAGLVVDGKAGEETQKVILGLNSDVLTVNGKTLTYPIRTLKRGMWGWDVYMLQQRLIAGNYLTGIYTKGEFDAATQKAVILAEKTFMITQDGIFGSQLRRYLWSTNVADDNDEASKYADWDQNGNFIGKTLRKGASGDAVRYVQMKLKANGFLLDDMDGIYGESTRKAVLALQKMINKQKKADGDDNYIKEDGVVGPQTWTIIRDLHQAASQDDYSLDANIDTPTEGAELVEVDPGEPAISAITRTLRQGSNGKQVKRLQQMMIQAGYLASGEDDGFYGPITKAAVLAFQQDVNSAYGSKVIKEDGVVGTQTLYHLQIKLSGQELPGKVKP